MADLLTVGRCGAALRTPEETHADLYPKRGAAAKVLAVLAAFNAPGGAISLAELADRSGLPKSTAHRMLSFLRDADFVESVEGQYFLSAKVSTLAEGTPAGLSPGERACLMPFLAELYELTHEVVQLTVRSGTSVQVVERIHGHRSARLAVQRGETQPLHRTAAGKVFLSGRAETPSERCSREQSRPSFVQELASVRATGIAFERGEWRPEVCGVAAAVRDARLEVVAAISIIGPTGRFRPEAVAPHLHKIAQVAGRELAAATRARVNDVAS
jgi:IclR family KDG regulon transcriptional repressor